MQQQNNKKEVKYKREHKREVYYLFYQVLYFKKIAKHINILIPWFSFIKRGAQKVYAKECSAECFELRD